MRATLFAWSCLLTACWSDGVSEDIPDLPPIAREDHLTIDEDTYFALDDLLANDDHVRDIELRYVTQPTHGRVGAVYNSSSYSSELVYQPYPGYYGTDQFSYVGTNTAGMSEAALVSVTIASDGIPYEHATFVEGGAVGDVALGDVDGDGQLDIVAAEYDTVRVLLTTSTAPRTVETTKLRFEGGHHTNAVELADLDGDGLVDIVIAAGSDGVLVLRNRGAATLEFDAPLEMPAGNASDVAVVDLDRDGKLDVASLDETGDALVVRLNVSTPGNVAFGTSYVFTTPYKPTRLAVGDADRRGGPDLIVLSTSASEMSLFVNAMAIADVVPAFAARIDRSTGSQPLSVVIADLDGDSFSEVAVGTYSGELWIYANRSATGGADGFIAARVLDIGYGTRRMAAMNLDGSGPIDLIVGGGRYETLTLLVNRTTPAGAFEFEGAAPDIGQVGLSTRVELGETYGLASGDVDGAGGTELVVTGSSGTFVLFE